MYTYFILKIQQNYQYVRKNKYDDIKEGLG